jgi:hypothetical protein
MSSESAEGKDSNISPVCGFGIVAVKSYASDDVYDFLI